jgi:hypothetical protein
VSEVFLTAWERRADFDPARAGAKAWLYGIAANMLRHHGTIISIAASLAGAPIWQFWWD